MVIKINRRVSLQEPGLVPPIKPLKTALSDADRRGEQQRGQISRKVSGHPVGSGEGSRLSARRWRAAGAGGGGTTAGLMSRWAAGERAQRVRGIQGGD